MPRLRARLMVAIDSWSSCAPQPLSQPLPPMAQVPSPIGVISISVLPSRRVCIGNFLPAQTPSCDGLSVVTRITQQFGYKPAAMLLPKQRESYRCLRILAQSTVQKVIEEIKV